MEFYGTELGSPKHDVGIKECHVIEKKDWTDEDGKIIPYEVPLADRVVIEHPESEDTMTVEEMEAAFYQEEQQAYAGNKGGKFGATTK